MAAHGHRAFFGIGEIVGEDVDDLHDKVGVRAAEADEEVGDDGAGEGEVFREHWGLECQHVGPAGGETLVIIHVFAGAAEMDFFRIGDGVGGVADVFARICSFCVGAVQARLPSGCR